MPDKRDTRQGKPGFLPQLEDRTRGVSKVFLQAFPHLSQALSTRSNGNGLTPASVTQVTQTEYSCPNPPRRIPHQPCHVSRWVSIVVSPPRDVLNVVLTERDDVGQLLAPPSLVDQRLVALVLTRVAVKPPSVNASPTQHADASKGWL